MKSLIYTKNTRSCILTSTGYYRLPSNQDRLLPTTLYAVYPVGSSPPEYTENARWCIMTSTGYYRLPSNQDRLLPTTLYAVYPVGSSPPEYTENTRWCIMTSTGHDRPGYIRSSQELGLRSTGSVSKTPTRCNRLRCLRPGRALPTVRIIVPSSPMVLVVPKITAQTIS